MRQPIKLCELWKQRWIARRSSFDICGDDAARNPSRESSAACPPTGSNNGILMVQIGVLEVDKTDFATAEDE
jgi:hypothetical protein